MIARYEHLAQKFNSIERVTLIDFRILQLLCHSISISSVQIFKVVKKSGFLATLINLLFRLPNANIVHNLIEKVIVHIFKSEKSIYEYYKEHLFHELDIIKMTTVGVINEEFKVLQKKGYLRHLVRIIKIYSQIETNNINITNNISKHRELWPIVINRILSPYEALTHKELGSYTN